jgi:hypothetical protein
MLYKICYRKKTVLTYEKLEDFLTLLQIRRRNSLRRLSQATGVSVGSDFKTAKLIKFHPFRVGVMHEFEPIDASQRSRFCNWMIKNMHDRLVDPNLLFINDEAYFHRTHEFGVRNSSLGSPDSST